MKVLIDIDDDTIEWAGHKAVSLKISRSKFLTLCLKTFKKEIDIVRPTQEQVDTFNLHDFTNFLIINRLNPEYLPHPMNSNYPNDDILPSTKPE